MDDSQFKEWAEGAESSTYFVMIKTAACSRCKALWEDEGFWGKFIDNREVVVFDPLKMPYLVDLLQKSTVSSVPIIIFRYKHEGKWRTFALRYVGDEDNCRNIMEALSENEFKFFGFNEYGEIVDPPAEIAYWRLLRLIYGELDSETIKGHILFKKQVQQS